LKDNPEGLKMLIKLRRSLQISVGTRPEFVDAAYSVLSHCGTQALFYQSLRKMVAL
jgi:hypothetical protein